MSPCRDSLNNVFDPPEGVRTLLDGPDGRLTRVRPADTSPEAWKLQLEILRRKGPLERLLMACRMSEELHGWERASMEARELPADRGT